MFAIVFMLALMYIFALNICFKKLFYWRFLLDYLTLMIILIWIVYDSIRKNIKKLFIVHPDAFIKNFIFVGRTFASSKFDKKLVEIYNWKNLNAYIKESDIVLPESTKGFITKSYTVTKINAKGKRQERLIKFTLRSLLNIDPKARTIQNETLLTEIAEIRTDTGLFSFLCIIWYSIFISFYTFMFFNWFILFI